MNKFKQIRKKAGLTHQQTSELLGIGYSTIVSYEREAPAELIKQFKILTKGMKCAH